MNCHESLTRLHGYLDRELTAVEIQAVERHLDDCPPCKELFQFEGKVLRLIQFHARQECCPDELRERIFRRLKSLPQRR